MANKGRRFRKAKNKLLKKIKKMMGKKSRSPYHFQVILTVSERKRRKYLNKKVEAPNDDFTII